MKEIIKKLMTEINKEAKLIGDYITNNVYGKIEMQKKGSKSA